MTAAPNRMARSVRLAFLAVAPGSICLAPPASADTRAGADVSVGASLETNPYLVSGSGSDVSGNVTIEPWLTMSDDVSSVSLHGSASLRQYAKSVNGTDVSGSAGLAATHRLSENFRLSGGFNYITSRNGINQGFRVVGPNDPEPPPTTPLPDTSLAGTRTRTQSVSANFGVSGRLSAFDTIGADITESHSSYSLRQGQNFNYLNAGLNYARLLSERTSLTASVRYGKSDYIHTRIGDGTIVTPQVGIQTTLSPYITLTASLGASFTNTTGPTGIRRKFTSFSGEARLCRKLEWAAMCLAAARSAQPTGLGSIQAVTSATLSYDTRLSRRDNLSLNLAFNSNDERARIVTVADTSKYYSAGATWSRTLGQRLSLYVSPNYARITRTSRSYNSFRLSAGLRYRFGAVS
jgi:hypothetical protein